MTTIFDPIQTPGAQLNIIDNGGMEIWQRGTTFSNPTSYTADRWNISTSCTTYSIAQESTIVDSGVYSMKLVITTPAGGVFRIGQSPENPAQYVGKTMSYSARVKSNIAGVKLFVSYIGGQTASTIAHTGDNTWQTLSMTIVMPNQGLTFSIGFDSVNTTVGSSVSPSAGTFYVDGVCMVAGSNPAVYVPLSLQEDLARCQRFYEIGIFNNTVPIQYDTTPRNRARGYLNFAVTKRISPTITTTLTGVNLVPFPPQGIGESSDTANWTVTAGALGVTSLYATGQRNTAQTTYSIMEFNFTWTASADF